VSTRNLKITFPSAHKEDKGIQLKFTVQMQYLGSNKLLVGTPFKIFITPWELHDTQSLDTIVIYHSFTSPREKGFKKYIRKCFNVVQLILRFFQSGVSVVFTLNQNPVEQLIHVYLPVDRNSYGVFRES